MLPFILIFLLALVVTLASTPLIRRLALSTGFVDAPAHTMQVVGDADAVPAVVAEFQRIIDATADQPAQVRTLERFAFYEAARRAFCIVQTAETRLYGNIILKKGIVAPD